MLLQNVYQMREKMLEGFGNSFFIEAFLKFIWSKFPGLPAPFLRDPKVSQLTSDAYTSVKWVSPSGSDRGSRIRR